MKKLFAIMIAFSLVLSLCSCNMEKAEKISIEMDKKVSDHFSDCMTVDDIIRDVKNIDFYYKPDTTGLKSETRVDEENDTSDIYWTDKKGNLVYRFYEGYGEKCFDYFTESKSGREAKVNYWDNDGKRYCVSISCDNYSITFSDLDSENPYGAKSIEVSIQKSKDSLLNESICYEYNEGIWTVYPCFYCDDEGYKQYWTYYDDGTNDIQSRDEIVHRHIVKEPECRSEMLTDEMITIVPKFVIPCYDLSYLGDPDNGQWYITSDFVLTFDSEEIRERYAAKYNITECEMRGNEDEYITLRTGEITIPISKDFENLDEFVNLWDVDDGYYKAVRLNGNGEIVSLYNTGTFSLY